MSNLTAVKYIERFINLPSPLDIGSIVDNIVLETWLLMFSVSSGTEDICPCPAVSVVKTGSTRLCLDGLVIRY